MTTTTAERTNLIREYVESYDVGDRRMAQRWFFSNTSAIDIVAIKNDFDHILCAEVDIEQYQDAQFRVFDQKNIAVLYGPFTSWASILKMIAEPCTFWLASNRWVTEELELILRSSYPHVILIDGTDQQEDIDLLVEDYMNRGFPESRVETEAGVIRIAPLIAFPRDDDEE